MKNSNDIISAEEFKEKFEIINGRIVSKKKRSGKFNATKIGEFDSIKESSYGKTLKILKHIGEISKYEHHLIYEFHLKGKLMFTYELDFKIYYPDGRIEYVDVKGIDKKTNKRVTSTAVFRLKRKIIEREYGIKIVTR